MIAKKNQLVNLCYLSFKLENSFYDDYQPYKYWARKIKFITNIFQENIIRLIFRQLLKDERFQKKKQFRKVFYLFNPTKRQYFEKYKNYDGIITFD
jgi:hypothetical protein